MSKQDEKSLPNAPTASTLYQHACILLNMSDRLRLIRFPPSIVDVVRQAINIGWPESVNKEREGLDFYEFKLNGDPWWCQGDTAIESRVLILNVLSALHSNGWHLLASSDISKNKFDKDLLVFQLGPPPPRTKFFAISFNEYDKLRIICGSEELIPAIRQALGHGFIRGECWLDDGAAYQFHIRGYPWIGFGENGTMSRLLLSLLDCLATFGWTLHASICLSQVHRSRTIDSWFFRRDIQ